jgi:hypothetical protein
VGDELSTSLKLLAEARSPQVIAPALTVRSVTLCWSAGAVVPRGVGAVQWRVRGIRRALAALPAPWPVYPVCLDGSGEWEPSDQWVLAVGPSVKLLLHVVEPWVSPGDDISHSCARLTDSAIFDAYTSRQWMRVTR